MDIATIHAVRPHHFWIHGRKQAVHGARIEQSVKHFDGFYIALHSGSLIVIFSASSEASASLL
jgi:hypothetical protein